MKDFFPCFVDTYLLPVFTSRFEILHFLFVNQVHHLPTVFFCQFDIFRALLCSQLIQVYVPFLLLHLYNVSLLLATSFQKLSENVVLLLNKLYCYMFNVSLTITSSQVLYVHGVVWKGLGIPVQLVLFISLFLFKNLLIFSWQVFIKSRFGIASENLQACKMFLQACKMFCTSL